MASAYLFVSYRQLRAKSSGRILSLEETIGELHKGLLEAKLEKSMALRTAEQIPMIIQKMTEYMPSDSYPPGIVRIAKEITNADKVGYFVPLADPDYFVLRVGYGFPDDWQGQMRIAWKEGAVGQALRKRIVLAKGDFEPDVFPGALPSLEKEGVEPDLVAPVYGVSGIAGVLVIAGCNLPPGSMKVTISMLVDLLSLSIQKATLLESREQVGYYDPLTGLSNRFNFMKIFESAIRKALNYQQPLSLLRFDVDRFRETIDTKDKVAGDTILQKIADVARNCTRSSHSIARFGENEFAVLLSSTKKEHAVRYAEKLRERIATTDIPIDDQKDPVRYTISGGISAFPEDGRSINELLHAASHALGNSKNAGMNRITLFRPAETGVNTSSREPKETETAPFTRTKTDTA
jgi:diguanylate cyclase (GGDEF)-like protein